MRQTKIGLILAVSSLLAACGDSDTSIGQTAAPQTSPVATIAPEAKKDELGDKRALLHDFEPLPLADLSLYRDSMQPLVLVDLYHSLTPSDEEAMDVAESMGYDINYAGFPPNIIELVSRYRNTVDAFEKRDVAKALSDALQSRKVEPSDRRVRLEVTSAEFGLGSYDFDRKGFPVGSSLLRPETGEAPSSWAPMSANPYAPRPRTYVAIPPSAYKLGFDKAEGLGFLKVEDEAVARVIESNIRTLKMVVYGSVTRIYRDYVFGVTPPKPKEDRYVIMQPQRADLVDVDGKVVFTVNL